jgi:hypothetical protein
MAREAAMVAREGHRLDPEFISRLAEAGWMATKGTAWLVLRSRGLVGLAVREWLSSGLAAQTRTFLISADQSRTTRGRTARGGNPST